MTINKQDQIWGIWFKEDLAGSFGINQGTAWAVISFLDKADFNQETYWRTLEEFPTMSGLFVEKGREDAVGTPLYEGLPNGANKFYMLSGPDASGVERFDGEFGREIRSFYLKYDVQPNTDSPFDDMLTLETFSTLEDAMTAEFSDRAVSFRRQPCATGTSGC